MKGSITVDPSKVTGFLRELKQITGATQKQVIRGEATKMVDKALSGTKVAKAETIRANHTPFPEGKRKWTRRNGKLYKLTNRYNGLLWDALESELEAKKKKLLSHRGISKKSFLVMAQAAGLEIVTPAYVVKAEGFDLTTVTGADEVEKGGDYVLTLRNDSTTNIPSDAADSFKAAVSGRVKFFQNNLKKGVFDSVEATAKKYPGIFAQGP